VPIDIVRLFDFQLTLSRVYK